MKKNSLPKLFKPETAKILGVPAAAVEMEILQLEEKWDDVLPPSLADVIESCYYLSSAEVCTAVKDLEEIGLVEGYSRKGGK